MTNCSHLHSGYSKTKAPNIQNLCTRLLEELVKVRVVTSSLVVRPVCSRGVVFSATVHSTISAKPNGTPDLHLRRRRHIPNFPRGRIPLEQKQANTTMNSRPPEPPEPPRHVEITSDSTREPQPATPQMPPAPPNAVPACHHATPAYTPMNPTENHQHPEPEVKADGAELTTPSNEEEPIAKSEPLHVEEPTLSRENVTSKVPAPARDIFDDLTSLGRTQEDLIPSEKLLALLEPRKPKKDEWVRCHEEIATRVSIYESSNTREIYLVLPELLEAMGDVVRQVRMTLAVNYAGEVFIWPVPVPIGRRAHRAHISAHAAAETASQHWIRIVWKGNDYEVTRRKVHTIDPEWPAEIPDASAMLRFACKTGGIEIIDSMEHPVVRELLGL